MRVCLTKPVLYNTDCTCILYITFESFAYIVQHGFVLFIVCAFAYKRVN